MTIRMMMTAAIAALALAGCERSSAVETRDRAAEAVEAVSPISGPAEAATADAASEVKPAVTANRRETVDAKIERLYRRNGAAFGARSAEDYLAKIEAFTARPPRATTPSNSS